jgi:hypothetical protein
VAFVFGDGATGGAAGGAAGVAAFRANSGVAAAGAGAGLGAGFVGAIINRPAAATPAATGTSQAARLRHHGASATVAGVVFTISPAISWHRGHDDTCASAMAAS